MKLETRAAFGWPATAAAAAACRNGLVVHYDGNDQGLAAKAHTACVAYWKATRKFHMGPERQWLDIGYSFGVCPHGIVLEGRGWARTQAAQPGGNTSWTSVTFMSGNHEQPTAAQLAAFGELRAWLRGKGLAAAVKGHREFVSTDCPGTYLASMVKSGALLGVPASVPTGYTRLLQVTDPLMRGDDVTWVQRQLNAYGAALTLDGAYGPRTAAEVKAFQTKHGLAADGQTGPKTWAALSVPAQG